jgi:hypothetical protein
MKRHVAVVAPMVALLSVVMFGQGGSPGRQTAATPTDADIRQAMGAIEHASSYLEILDATERYEGTIGSPRAVELADEYLRNPALNDSQRGLIGFERQLSIDCRTLGPTAAARLISVRIVAASALLADSPEQLAAVLGRFTELAGLMNVQLVRDALSAPGSTWPPALIPVMEQLTRDWRQYGALGAATRMANGAQAATGSGGTTAPAAPQAGGANASPTVAGHWRNTRIVFERPVDEHFVLNADGSAETWIVRASGQEPTTGGRWRTEGTTLVVEWEDGRRRQQPYTFYQGQLVLPNIANQRQFWDRVR